MSGEKTKPSLRERAIATLLRPIEYGLIGLALVLVVHLANRFEALPSLFKGAGFELQFKKTENAVTKTEARIVELENQLQKLRGDLTKVVKELDRTQNITLSAASIAALPEDSRTLKTARIDATPVETGDGFSWLGTYNTTTNSWTDRSFDIPGTQDVRSLKELMDKQIVFNRDINLRTAWPHKDDRYYDGIEAIGVVKSGTNAMVEGRPVTFDRPNGLQVWAKIKTTYTPYFTRTD